MRAEEIRRVAVLGAGEMGHGLAELFALRGIEVGLRDIGPALLDRAMERIRWSLGKLRDRGMLPSPEGEVLGRIHPTTDLEEALRGAQFVVEAVPEDLALKRRVLAEVEALVDPGVVLASNTSGLPITAIAAAAAHPDRVVGMHFFNPPVLMELVEVVRGAATSEATFALALALARRLGKTPVACRKDSPGFITSRLIAHYLHEAALIHDAEGVPIEAIDAALRFGVGFPMGPFELADQVGIDLLVQASRAQGLPVPRPFEALVAEGRLGRKVGRGFYDYGGGRRVSLDPGRAAGFDPLRILAPIVNEAARLVEEGVAEPPEIDLAMRLGTAFPLGPLAQGDAWGLDRVLAVLRASGRHQPSPLLEAKVARGETGRAAGRGFYEYGGKEVERFETIRVERSADGKIATVVLNRPDRLNTLTPQMVEEIDGALGALRGAPELRCLVIRGQGPRAFCAGADVTAFLGADRAHKVWAFTRRTQEVFRALEAFPTPTIAAIDGYALGGGCELALACDFRLASKRSTLGQTEITLGLIPGAGGTQRLVRTVGLARAKEAVLLGKRFTAAEAQALGLVHAVVEDEGFEGAVAELAAKLAEGPPIALRLAKQLLNAAAAPGPEAGFALEAAAFAVVTSTEDVAEGLQAFLDRRKPQFKGS